MHYNKLINDQSLNSYCNNYKNDTLLRRINTYHCKINNTWYTDIPSIDPLIDVYVNQCSDVELSLDVILKYLNRFLNKNKNYCIDQFYYKYVKPIIESSNDISKIDWNNKDLNIKSYDQLERDGSLYPSFYCCVDCD